MRKRASTRNFSGYHISDSNPLSKSSHLIEVKQGFETAGRAMVSKEGNEWHLCDLFTNPKFRGKGIAKQILAYVNDNYGDYRIEASNPEFWKNAGFERGKDGYWRKVRG